ncbi:MAG: TetR/AcrR family transcriptional regulator [Oscillospiraceae bacterium]|nr:TetR/AcrR family transcriptional regulator [Oscillospiraceae bacterium]
MNKNESKYFNTAVKMNKALILLLEKKDFEYITIKEICQTAGVNRSTFYLHYDNTADLLKETTQYITDSFFSYFSTDMQLALHKVESSRLNELMFISPEYLTPYLTFIKENQRIFSTSLKQFDSMCFDNLFDDLFKLIFNPVLIRFDIPERERIYILKFYLMGITAIVMEWLGNHCTESINFISKIITDCVIGKLNFNDK